MEMEGRNKQGGRRLAPHRPTKRSLFEDNGLVFRWVYAGVCVSTSRFDGLRHHAINHVHVLA